MGEEQASGAAEQQVTPEVTLEVTPAKLAIFQQSPFIAYQLMKGVDFQITTGVPMQMQEYTDAVEDAMLARLCGDEPHLDLSTEEDPQLIAAEIASGQHRLITKPFLTFHDTHGVVYAVKAHLLKSPHGERPHGGYRVTVVSSSSTVKPQHISQALFCHFVLERMLMLRSSSDGDDSAALALADHVVIAYSGNESETPFKVNTYQVKVSTFKDMFNATRLSYVKLLLGHDRAPAPSASDLRLRPEYAAVARQQLLRQGSLEVLEDLTDKDRKWLARAAKISTLAALRAVHFDELGLEPCMSKEKFKRVRMLAKLFADESKDHHVLMPESTAQHSCPASASGLGAAVCLDVITSAEDPLQSALILGTSKGQCKIFNATPCELESFVKSSTHDSAVAYYFGSHVKEQVLLLCLALERADLAARVAERLYAQAGAPSWVDLSERLSSHVVLKAGQSFEAACKAFFPDTAGNGFHLLPALLEYSRNESVSQDLRKDARRDLEKLATAKLDDLRDLSKKVPGSDAAHCAPSNVVIFISNLRSVSQGFKHALPATNPRWPAMWHVVKKWHNYFKHDTFWGLIDAIELFRAPEDRWTEHVLCLSKLARVQHAGPHLKGSGRRSYMELEIRYQWYVDQETTIKEKDDVFVREDASLRGRVKALQHNGAGKKSEIVLVFDTNFGKNGDLGRLLRTDFETISIMQAKFLVTESGVNILSRAVEEKLLGIIASGWTAMPSCFRNFLQRRPVGSISIAQSGNKSKRPGEMVEEIVARLQGDYLIIQGPPGTGKTHTSSQIIACLCREHPAPRIAVSSNSHKAIRNLLSTASKKFRVNAAKVLADNETAQELAAEGISPIENAREIALPSGAIVGGTASQLMKMRAAVSFNGFFSDDFDGAFDEALFDYLFVDEAGQVPLELLAVLAQRTRNLVLVGDQQQLPPPVQERVKSARAGGMSCLDYFTDGAACVSESCGIFLATTYRMSSSLTRVVSDNFYDGNLKANDLNAGNRVVLKRRGLIECESGVQFIEMAHEGNLQCSEEESEAVCSAVDQLLGCEVVIDKRDPKRITADDIIIVCPYNAQVMMIKSKLAAAAASTSNPKMRNVRVGSVDLFQGQEAAVALISLGSSVGAGGRLLFVLDPKRTNVALSRAKALAVIVGSPALSDSKVDTEPELALQNRYAKWLKQDFSG